MESNRPGIRGLNQQHTLLILYLSLWNKVGAITVFYVGYICIEGFLSARRILIIYPTLK